MSLISAFEKFTLTLRYLWWASFVRSHKLLCEKITVIYFLDVVIFTEHLISTSIVAAGFLLEALLTTQRGS